VFKKKNFLHRDVQFENFNELFSDYNFDAENNSYEYLKTFFPIDQKFYFIDIGCQKGLYSSKVLNEFKHAKVFGYDPVKHKEIEKLEENPNFSFSEKAIANGKNINTYVNWEYQIQYKTKSEILDRRISSDSKVYLKIDIDGNEIKLVRNLAKFINLNKPLVQIEIYKPTSYILISLMLYFKNLVYIRSHDDINHFYLYTVEKNKLNLKNILDTFLKLINRLYKIRKRRLLEKLRKIRWLKKIKKILVK